MAVTIAPARAAGAEKEKDPAVIRSLIFVRDRGIFVLWALLLIAFSIWASPYFASVDNALLIANAAALTAIFAAGVAVGIICGALDLSIPGTAALASCVCGWLITHGTPTWVSIVVALVLGALVGAVNGLITLRGFNPIVVTIGTLSAMTGLASVIAAGYTIPGLDSLTFMGTQRYLGVPAPVWITAAVFAAGTVFLTRTRDGIRLMAVGGNPEAVRRSGIHADRYKVLGFVISGVLRRARRPGDHGAGHRGQPGGQREHHLQRADRGRAGRCLAGRRARVAAAGAGRRADPGHHLERTDHQGHPAVLGHRGDRPAAARLARRGEVGVHHGLEPAGAVRPRVRPHRNEVTRP